ncbi:MAG TPA: hypothetical protein VFK50_04730 [Sphingomicrobium sp.]|nr:hypothetical protein [Sphingomicrobium sp.]
MRFLFVFCLVLAACDRRPEVPTATENRDLDEAGRMLDAAGGNLPAADDNGVRPAGDRDPK